MSAGLFIPTLSSPGGKRENTMKSKPLSGRPEASAAAEAFTHNAGEALKALSTLSLPLPTLSQMQGDYVKQATALWNQSLHFPQPGTDAGTAASTKASDRRFAGQDWATNPAAAYTAQMYLLNARTLMQMADAMQGDQKTRQRVRFAVQQWVDASSPSNYLALNPEAQRKALETQGESIVQGL